MAEKEGHEPLRRTAQDHGPAKHAVSGRKDHATADDQITGATMNQEQIAKLKEVALKAPKNPGEWPFYLRSFQAAASPAVILELIALAEHSLSAQDEVLTDDRKSCCGHDSDCAVHNEPAYAPGPCDCSLSAAAPEFRQLLKDYSFYGIERGTPPLIAYIDGKLAQASSSSPDLANLVRYMFECRGMLKHPKGEFVKFGAVEEVIAAAPQQQEAAREPDWRMIAEGHALQTCEMEARAIAAESRLAEIQRGVDGIRLRQYGHYYDADEVNEILALIHSSSLPG